MPEYLDRLKEIIEEHRAIRSYVRLVGDSISDKEALSSLEQAQATVAGQPEVLSYKLERLKQTLNQLDEGLRNHFAREEDWLPPVLGKYLMKALLIEHGEMRKSIEDARSAALATVVSELDDKGLAARDAELKTLVERLSQIIMDHAAMEDRVLGMLEKAVADEEPV